MGKGSIRDESLRSSPDLKAKKKTHPSKPRHIINPIVIIKKCAIRIPPYIEVYAEDLLYF